jgi:hypothetical protein
LTQLQIWAYIAQSAINFIVIYIIQGSGQQKTVTDMKTDLRTTKEDIMAEIKEIRNFIEGKEQK